MKKIKKVSQTIAVIGKVLNSKSTSTQDTYSCDYINNNVGIVESGSNENGSYIKFADGNMICYTYKSFLTGSQYGDFMWEFPKPFINTNFSVIAPNVVTSGDSGQYTCGENARANNYCQFIVYKNAANYTGKTRAINLFAIGRWK